MINVICYNCLEQKETIIANYIYHILLDEGLCYVQKKKQRTVKASGFYSAGFNLYTGIICNCLYHKAWIHESI